MFNMICAFVGLFLLLRSISPVLADEFADEDENTGYVDGCKDLVGSLTLMLHDVEDPVSGWEEPVKECFEEAHKKTMLAFECGPKFEEVCLDYFKDTENYDEAVQLRGSYETLGASSITLSLFVLLLVMIVKLTVRIGV